MVIPFPKKTRWIVNGRQLRDGDRLFPYRTYTAKRETPVRASSKTIRKITMKIAKKTRAMLRVPEATLVNPSIPAITEITKKINAHFNTTIHLPKISVAIRGRPNFDGPGSTAHKRLAGTHLRVVALRLFPFVTLAETT